MSDRQRDPTQDRPQFCGGDGNTDGDGGNYRTDDEELEPKSGLLLRQIRGRWIASGRGQICMAEGSGIGHRYCS